MTALRGRTTTRLERSGGLGRLHDGVEGAPSRRVFSLSCFPFRVISVGVNDANVVATYLRRAPGSAPILARHALLLVEPYRGPHDRALVPAPLTPILDAMRGFRASSLRVKDGVQIITLTSRMPTPINPAAIPDATVFRPSR